MTSTMKSSSGGLKRKTLVQQQAEVPIRDPAGLARQKVSELDKTAKSATGKKHLLNMQIENDTKEIAHLDDQIQRIQNRYNPLCSQLAERIERREQLIKTLNTCLGEERNIMGSSRNAIEVRRKEDSKFLRKMATIEMQQARGYEMSVQSTFHQTK